MGNKDDNELILYSEKGVLPQLFFLKAKFQQEKKKRQRPHRQFTEEKYRNGQKIILKVC